MSDIFIPTYTGRHFTPLAPRAEDVDIKDIAHSLSMQCRYNGHSQVFYSVAEHSVLMSRQVSGKAALYALMHDAAEAYLSDIVTPIKKYLRLEAVEKEIWHAVQRKFGVVLTPEVIGEVELADLKMLATEKNQIINDEGEWAPLQGIAPYDLYIMGWEPKAAEAEFLNRFKELSGRPVD